MTTATASRATAITDLMTVPDADVDDGWLRRALGEAVLLELATIPVYACGLWSIMDQARDALAHRTVRDAVFDQMANVGRLGNLLTAIGGEPVLTDPDRLPTYPGGLPGGLRPDVELRLSGLTRAALAVYCAVEEPDDDPVTSVTSFYRRVEWAFDELRPALSAERQIEHQLFRRDGGPSITALADPAAVRDALVSIGDKGGPDPVRVGTGELAHHHAFRQLHVGRRLVRESSGAWRHTGDVITPPRCYAVAEVPAGGWAHDPVNDPTGKPVSAVLEAFNDAYSDMLSRLEQAWRTADPVPRRTLVDAAIGQMAELRRWGRLITQIPLPDGSGWHYCPEFLFSRVESAAPAPRAGR